MANTMMSTVHKIYHMGELESTLAEANQLQDFISRATDEDWERLRVVRETTEEGSKERMYFNLSYIYGQGEADNFWKQVGEGEPPV